MLAYLFTRSDMIGQAARFLTMTALSAATTFGLPIILFEIFSIEPRYGTAIGFVTAFVLNFASLRLFVFRSTKSIRRDFRIFVASSIVFRALEYAFFLFLNVALGLYYVVALALVLTIGTISKFLWYRWMMPGPKLDHLASRQSELN